MQSQTMIVVRPLCFILLGSLLIFLLAASIKQLYTPRLYVKNCANSEWNGIYYNTAVTADASKRKGSGDATDNVWVYSKMVSSTEKNAGTVLYGRESWKRENQRFYWNVKEKAYYVRQHGKSVYLKENAKGASEITNAKGCVLKEGVLLPFYHPVLSLKSPTTYIQQYPVTSLLTAVLCVIWFVIWNYKVDVTEFASSYNSVVNEGEMWRILSSSFSHESILHIAMNVNSLLSLSFLETRQGSIPYL